MKRLALALCATLLTTLAGHAEEPLKDATETAEADMVGGAFILVDQDGRTVTDQDFLGSFLLVAFGYTHCPDVCPTTLMTMASALHLLGADAKAMRPVFITVDPERDTPTQLKDYVGSFGAEFVGLSGPEALVANAAQKFHVVATKVPLGHGEYSIDHTAGIFLMGPDGAFLQRFAHDVAAKDLAEAMRAARRGHEP